MRLHIILIIIALLATLYTPVHGAPAENEPLLTIRYNGEPVEAGFVVGGHVVVVLNDGRIEFYGLNGTLIHTLSISGNHGGRANISVKGAEACGGRYIGVWGTVNNTGGFINIIDAVDMDVKASYFSDTAFSALSIDKGCRHAAYYSGRKLYYLTISLPTGRILVKWSKEVSEYPSMLLVARSGVAALYENVFEPRTTIHYYNSSGARIYTEEFNDTVMDADAGGDLVAVASINQLLVLNTSSGETHLADLYLAAHVYVAGKSILTAEGSALKAYSANATLLASFDAKEIAGQYGSGITGIDARAEDTAIHVAVSTSNGYIIYVVLFSNGSAKPLWYWRNPEIEDVESLHIDSEGNLTAVTWWTRHLTSPILLYRVTVLAQPQPIGGQSQAGEAGGSGTGAAPGETPPSPKENESAATAAGETGSGAAGGAEGEGGLGSTAIAALAVIIIVAVAALILIRR